MCMNSLYSYYIYLFDEFSQILDVSMKAMFEYFNMVIVVMLF